MQLRACRFGRWITAKPHPAAAAQGDADDGLEVRDIAMPAQRRSGAVLRDQRVIDCCRRQPGPLGCAFAQRMQPFGHRGSRHQFQVGEVVTPTEADDAAAGSELFVLGLLQWQGLERLQQRLLLVWRKEVRFIPQALRQRWRCLTEQIWLRLPVY